MNPIKVNFAFKGSVANVLTQTIKELVTYVDNHEDAHLIIFSDLRQLVEIYDESRKYLYLPMRIPADVLKNQKPNILQMEGFDLSNSLLKVLEKLAEISEDLPILLKKETHEEVAPVELLPDAKCILVIDDTEKHLIGARKDLAGHNVITVDSYEKAMDIMSKEKFEVVLTDLHLPMSSRTLSGEAFKIGELVPYGLLLMIEAARQGAKYVAIVTDLGHHDDPFSAAFDHFGQFYTTIEGAKTMMLRAHLNNGVKDWASPFKSLTE